MPHCICQSRRALDSHTTRVERPEYSTPADQHAKEVRGEGWQLGPGAMTRSHGDYQPMPELTKVLRPVVTLSMFHPVGEDYSLPATFLTRHVRYLCDGMVVAALHLGSLG